MWKETGGSFSPKKRRVEKPGKLSPAPVEGETLENQRKRGFSTKKFPYYYEYYINSILSYIARRGRKGRFL